MAVMEMRMTKRANSREPTADAQPGDVSVVLVVPKTSTARMRALSSDFIPQTSVRRKCRNDSAFDTLERAEAPDGAPLPFDV